jgi:predicted amidohydrolase
MPIWGGNETLMRARAIENAAYLVSSSYDAPTGILDPLGKWLDVVRPGSEGVVPAEGRLTLAQVDLDSPKPWEWVGDFARRLHLERRPDLAAALAHDGPPGGAVS